MEVQKNEQLFDVRQLSDGEKCLLALAGDLAHRLAIANPDITNPLEGFAIVLIDEVDLHLHPEWQHRIIPKLTQTFPNCQFVVTTHSPQILSHVRCQDIWCINQEDGKLNIVRPDGTYGQDSNFLLKTLMGSSYRPDDIDQKIKHLFELIREDTVKARKLLNELKTEIEGDSPDIVRAEVLLHRREVLNK
jgi:predicted ATP-binding protein involved in virulence